MDDAALLEIAAGLAWEAGSVILELRARGVPTERKADQSPVTEADRAAERLILAGLARATPAIPALSEEAHEAGAEVRMAPLLWVVDPLDGTREFAAGRDAFAVNIGLVREGRAVLGAVGLPASGEVFCGIVGRGATRRDASGERPIRARTPPAEGLHVLASRHHGSSPRLEAFLAGKMVAKVLHFGSAAKFCRLAEGAADLYPRFGRTMEWDTAAPQAVLEAAGGTVATLDGAPLRYGKPGWENPGFCATGRPA